MVYRALNLDPRARLLVFTSRLDDQKRPDDALEVFSRVQGEFSDLHLVMAGCGEAEDRVKALAARHPAANRIHFPGFQPNVPDWLAAAAVWLFPTESENFSLALLEAMAAGCPIVSTLCQGNDEILVDGRNALTARVGDVETMAAATRRILSDPGLDATLRWRARHSRGLLDRQHGGPVRNLLQRMPRSSPGRVIPSHDGARGSHVPNPESRPLLLYF